MDRALAFQLKWAPDRLAPLARTVASMAEAPAEPLPKLTIVFPTRATLGKVIRSLLRASLAKRQMTTKLSLATAVVISVSKVAPAATAGLGCDSRPRHTNFGTCLGKRGAHVSESEECETRHFETNRGWVEARKMES